MIKAIHEDIPSIVNLTREFYEESDSALPFDPVVFSSTVARFINDENCCAMVYKEGENVKGFLLGICSQYPAADLIQANELLWYCSRDSRGKGAMKLIKQYLKWAKNKGASVIYSGAFEKRASIVYKRMGFELVDENWVSVN